MSPRRSRSRKKTVVQPGDAPTVLNVSALLEWIGLPGLVAGALWIGASNWSPNHEMTLDVEVVTGCLLGILAGLALLLRQGRPLLVSLLLSHATYFDPTSAPWRVSLPLILAALVVLTPRHPLRRRNLVTFCVLVGLAWVSRQPGVVPLVDSLRSVTGPTIGPEQWGFGLAGVVLVATLLARPSPLGRAALWSLPFLYCAWIPLFEENRWHPLAFSAAVLLWILGALGEAHALSFRDGLTRLPGRRAFDREIGELGRRYVIAMVDIDHFKRFNDRHGHGVGDQVLAKVAAQLARVRGGRAFRYGGEEFAVVFPGRNRNQCEGRLEELRRRIEGAPFGVRGAKKRLKVTVSIGAAERSAEYRHPEDVLAAADKALYRAKRAGRNRVQLAA